MIEETLTLPSLTERVSGPHLLKAKGNLLPSSAAPAFPDSDRCSFPFPAALLNSHLNKINALLFQVAIKVQPHRKMGSSENVSN